MEGGRRARGASDGDELEGAWDKHPSTLTSMNNLAFTLMSQGLINRAISLMEDCYKLRAVVLGPRHPFTISSRETLATWQSEAMALSK